MQKAIVVGATSGIGKALTLLLAKHHYTVGITGRRADLLAELKQENPENFHALAFDVVDFEQTAVNLNQLAEKLGGVDLLIYCAGVGELNAYLAIDLELPTIDVNVKAFNQVVVWGYKQFEQQKKGQIAVITSIAGLRGGAISPAYNASKAYQINYLEGLRQKANQQKLEITITDLRPGFVATAMAKGDQQFWVAEPEKAALQIFNAIKAKKSVSYITKRWNIIAWLLKLMPRFLYQRL
ncbi:SDR family NAD(P)-dependent oxidoreductase [Pedobacter sp. Hv1]|uniref:SDR family NAD(P)-dependent oxidoreductase n=1 Tax=Pedobacter sp. Hv1 TaxID=1740090 RepID=UPI0006D8A8AB|nr:SDR family NAD(P)-dependent oxidoreductase [Pedobacter sp. Hv1]KQC02258.1 oxidoreductase [Pedobacter sp. Hv1]